MKTVSIENAQKELKMAKLRGYQSTVERLEKLIVTLQLEDDNKKVIEPKQMEDTLDNRAAFLFYN